MNTPARTQCSTCDLRDVCLPRGLNGLDLQRLDGLLLGRRKIASGHALFNVGDTFECIYAVRSGTFKSTLVLPDGHEQVCGFQIAGELLGLDAVATGAHASCATALEDSEICAIPYGNLMDDTAQNRFLQGVMGRWMSREIVRGHSLMVLLGSMNAQERLASFLMNLAQRHVARGYSGAEFHLRMSRAEIGSYLGLKLETVSRAFSAFQLEGLLEVDRKHVRIVDPARLSHALENRCNEL